MIDEPTFDPIERATNEREQQPIIPQPTQEWANRKPEPTPQPPAPVAKDEEGFTKGGLISRMRGRIQGRDEDAQPPEKKPSAEEFFSEKKPTAEEFFKPKNLVSELAEDFKNDPIGLSNYMGTLQSHNIVRRVSNAFLGGVADYWKEEDQRYRDRFVALHHEAGLLSRPSPELKKVEDVMAHSLGKLSDTLIGPFIYAIGAVPDVVLTGGMSLIHGAAEAFGEGVATAFSPVAEEATTRKMVSRDFHAWVDSEMGKGPGGHHGPMKSVQKGVDARAIGPGIDSRVFDGIKDPPKNLAPQIALSQQDANSLAPKAPKEKGPPTVHDVAVANEPKLMGDWEAVNNREKTLDRWVKELEETRDTDEVAHIDRDISQLERRSASASPALAEKFDARIEELYRQREEALRQAKEKSTPDLDRVRADLEETRRQKEEMAPEVDRAYQEAAQDHKGLLEGHEAREAERKRAAEEQKTPEPEKPFVRLYLMKGAEGEKDVLTTSKGAAERSAANAGQKLHFVDVPVDQQGMRLHDRNMGEPIFHADVTPELEGKLKPYEEANRPAEPAAQGKAFTPPPEPGMVRLYEGKGPFGGPALVTNRDPAAEGPVRYVDVSASDPGLHWEGLRTEGRPNPGMYMNMTPELEGSLKALEEPPKAAPERNPLQTPEIAAERLKADRQNIEADFQNQLISAGMPAHEAAEAAIAEGKYWTSLFEIWPPGQHTSAYELFKAVGPEIVGPRKTRERLVAREMAQREGRVTVDADEVRATLSASTSTIPGINRLMLLAEGGDKRAAMVLHHMATDALEHLLSGIPTAKLEVTHATGLYGGSLEASLGVSIHVAPEERSMVLAALERFAKNFNQEQIHVRAGGEAGTGMGHTYSDGSYNTRVIRFNIETPMSRAEVEKVIADSGLYGMTSTDKYLEAYYVGNPRDTKAIAEFERSIERANTSLGSNVTKIDQEIQRLWPYGRGEGAAVGYEHIAGEFPAPKGEVANRTAHRIAATLSHDREVIAEPQAKTITPQQRSLQQRIKDAYERLKVNALSNPNVRKAYEHLATEVRSQYDALPVKVELWDFDRKNEPYENSAAMRRDVLDNNHLYVLATNEKTFGPPGVTYENHPLLAKTGKTAKYHTRDAKGNDITVDRELTYNDMLRAVHDYYAHTMTAADFGAKGEEAAWRIHMSMTSDPWARWALTTETRGQNSWVNFRDEVQGKPYSERGFAEQKVDLLPVEYALTGDPVIDAGMEALPGFKDAELHQTRRMREGSETLKKYGLGVKKRYTIREVAQALQDWVRSKHGNIAMDDYSVEASKKISKWIVEEIKFEAEMAKLHPDQSAFGWYSIGFQKALDGVGDAIFHEFHKEFDFAKSDLPGVKLLGNQKNARDLFTAIVAITSDGAKVSENFKNAVRIYNDFRHTGKLDLELTTGGTRMESMRQNLKNLQEFLDEYGPSAMHEELLKEKTVSQLKKMAKAEGVELSTGYLAETKMPKAALVLGPKLGAFYANLMGRSGYLTMDRWWSRSFNRYRGNLVTEPTRQGLDRFKQLVTKDKNLNEPWEMMSDDRAIDLTVEYEASYRAKKFKDGSEIEKAANTIFKDAFKNLEDQPNNASDRAFMIATAKRAQKALRKAGIDLTISDIQAGLWFYEQRLFAKLGSKTKAGMSYGNVAREAAIAERERMDRRGRPSAQDVGREPEIDGSLNPSEMERTRGRETGAVEEPFAPDDELEQRRSKSDVMGAWRPPEEGGKPRVRFTDKRDASTWWHEGWGHDKVERLMRIATEEWAPPQLKKDAQAVLDYLGIKDWKEAKRSHKERMAEMMENWVLKGRAPTKILADVFDRIRKFLSEVYSAERKGRLPDVPENMDDVFGRMLTGYKDEPVITGEIPRERAPHDVHAAAAEQTPGEHARGTADKIEGEIMNRADEVAPEVADELRNSEGPEMGENSTSGGNAPRPSPGQAATPTGNGVERAGTGETAKETGGTRAAGQELPPTDGPLVDKAGNIRLDNWNTAEEIKDALRDMAAQNDGFIGQRRGVVSDAQVVETAEAAGVDVVEALVKHQKVGTAFNAEELTILRMALEKSAAEALQAAKMAATGDDAAVMAYATARERHRLIQQVFSGATAEAGRALRALRKTESTKQALEIAEIMKNATGRSVEELRKEAELFQTLTTTQQISQFIAATARAKPGSMIIEAWLATLLSGPRTFLRNLNGNFVGVVTDLATTKMAEVIGAGFQAIGRERGVQAGEATARFYGMLRGAEEGFVASKYIFKHEEVLSDVSTAERNHGPAIPSRRTVNATYEIGSPEYKARLAEEAKKRAAYEYTRGDIKGITSAEKDIEKARDDIIKRRAAELEAAPPPSLVQLAREDATEIGGRQIRLPLRALGATDEFFRAVALRGELHTIAWREAMKSGLKGDQFEALLTNLQINPTEEMMAEAIKHAQYQTFTKPLGPVGQALQTVSNSHPLGKIAITFVRTPVNLLKYSVEHSPLAILQREARENMFGYNGAAARDKQIARMAVGTMAALAIYKGVIEDRVTGGGPSDMDRKRLWMMTGWRPYSVRIGDAYYSYNWLPMASMLGIIADLAHVSQVIKSDEEEDIAKLVFASFTKNIADQSWLSGTTNLVRSYSDPDRYGMEYVKGLAASFVVPAFVSQLNQELFDPYARESNSILDSIKARVPGQSTDLFQKIDIFGNPIERTTPIKDDPILKIMNDLAMSPAPVAKKINGVELTPDQHHDLAVRSGVMFRAVMEDAYEHGLAELQPFEQRLEIGNLLRQTREAAATSIKAESAGDEENDIMAKAYDLKFNKLMGVKK